MALPDVKLPPLTAVIAGIRAALAEGAAELRKLAESAPEPLRGQLVAAAARLEHVLDSTELASVGLAALAEIQEMLATGKAPARHDVTDGH